MNQPEEAPDHQGYCWPSLGEACGECDRCKETSCVGKAPVDWPDMPRTPDARQT